MSRYVAGSAGICHRGRDEHAIHFRCAAPTANPEKYQVELLDGYLFVEDAGALYAEYVARGVEVVRELGDTPWQTREFGVKDCDGRLLAFGANSAWPTSARNFRWELCGGL